MVSRSGKVRRVLIVVGIVLKSTGIKEASGRCSDAWWATRFETHSTGSRYLWPYSTVDFGR
jgi:hypothetical protein